MKTVVVLYALWLTGPVGPVDKVSVGLDFQDRSVFSTEQWDRMALDNCLRAREEMTGARIETDNRKGDGRHGFECIPSYVYMTDQENPKDR